MSATAMSATAMRAEAAPRGIVALGTGPPQCFEDRFCLGKTGRQCCRILAKMFRAARSGAAILISLWVGSFIIKTSHASKAW